MSTTHLPSHPALLVYQGNGLYLRRILKRHIKNPLGDGACAEGGGRLSPSGTLDSARSGSIGAPTSSTFFGSTGMLLCRTCAIDNPSIRCKGESRAIRGCLFLPLNSGPRAVAHSRSCICLRRSCHLTPPSILALCELMKPYFRWRQIRPLLSNAAALRSVRGSS